MDEYNYHQIQMTVIQSGRRSRFSLLMLSMSDTTGQEIVDFLVRSYMSAGVKVDQCAIVKSGKASDLFPGMRVGVMRKFDVGDEIGKNMKRIEEAAKEATRSRIVQEIVHMRDSALATGETQAGVIIDAVARSVFNRDVEVVMEAQADFTDYLESTEPELGFINLGKDMGRVQ